MSETAVKGRLHRAAIEENLAGKERIRRAVRKRASELKRDTAPRGCRKRTFVRIAVIAAVLLVCTGATLAAVEHDFSFDAKGGAPDEAVHISVSLGGSCA